MSFAGPLSSRMAAPVSTTPRPAGEGPAAGQPSGPSRPDRGLALGSITRMLQAPSASLGIREALQTPLDAAREIFAADAGAIRLLQGNSADLALAAWTGLTEGEAAQLPPAIPLTGEQVEALVARTQVPACLPRAGPPEDPSPGPPWQPGLRSLLCVPLLVKERTVGTLLLGARRAGVFGPDTLALATTMAQLVTAALDGPIVHAEVERLSASAVQASARADALAAIGRAVAAALELDEILDVIVDRTLTATQAEACGIFRWDPARDVFLPVAVRGLSETFRREFAMARHEGVSGLVFREGGPVWSADVLADPRLEFTPRGRDLVRAEGFRSLLAVPLHLRAGLFGTLVTYRWHPHHFGDEEVRFQAALADQAAVAIENARLLEQEREAARNAERQRARAEALAAVGQAISASLELDEILGLLVERTAAATGADAVAVVEREEETGTLSFRRARGLSSQYRAGLALPAGAGIAGPVLAAGQAMWSADILVDGRFTFPEEARGLMRAEGIRGVLCVPIRGGGAPFGLLSLYWRERHPFEEEEIAFAGRIADQAALALENARLFRQERQRRRQLEAVRSVTEEITRELDLGTVLGLITRRAAELAGAEAGAVYLWDEGAETLVPHSWHGLGDWMREVRLRLGEGVTGTVAQRRKGLIVNDYRAWPSAIPLFVERTGGAAALGEPLLYGDNLLGVLTVSNGTEGQRFREQDRQTLAFLAAQAAIAIQNARHYQGALQKAEEVAALYEAGKAVTESLELDTTLGQIAETARHLAGADRTFLWLVDPQDGSLRAGIASGPGAEAFLGTRVPADSPATAARAAREGRPLVIENALDADAADPALSARLGNAALLAIPLRIQAAIPGVLVCGYSRPRTFPSGEVERLKGLAQQAAIAIQNARLYREVQRRLEATQRQSEAARALLEVSQALTRTLELNQVFDLIVEKILAVTGAGACGISRITSGGDLEYIRATGFYDSLNPPTSLPRGEGLMGRCLEVRAPVWSRDVLADPAVQYRPERRVRVQAEDMHGGLAVPILTSDGPYGVLFIGRRVPHDHTPEEIAFAESLAAQAGIAIENARLYAETRGALEELAAIHEASQAIAQSLDLQETLRHILAAAMRLTGTDKGIIYLFDAERGELRGTSVSGLGGVAEVRLPLSVPSLAAACLRESRVLISETPEDDPRINPDLQARYGNRTVVAVPIRSGARPIGVLDLADVKRRRHLTAREIGILERLAQQAVVAIENARLYAETRRAYENLQAAQEQLVQVEKLRALGEMAGGVAHDFNNVLAAILARAQLLRMRATDPPLREGLEVIERAALDGAETVRRILGFARVGPEASPTPVDPGALIPQVLEMTRARWKDEAQARGAPIEARLAVEPVPPVRGNAAELREVLVNLIFNAVDAMPRGGHLTVGTRRIPQPARSGRALPTRREVVEVWGSGEGGFVELFVQDSGVGMPEEVRRRAFDPFFTTKGVRGSGLGLSVVYGIVSRHGGDVVLESQEGKGTTVIVRLPATAGCEAAPPAEKAPPPPGRPGRIVVVDDDGALSEVLSDVLRLQHHRVDAYTDPLRALERLGREPADLLFTDLGMPEISGWDVARRAREIQPGLPVILVTGWGHQIDAAQARERGVNAVVTKPYRLQDIARVVAELLRAAGGDLPSAF